MKWQPKDYRSARKYDKFQRSFFARARRCLSRLTPLLLTPRQGPAQPSPVQREMFQSRLMTENDGNGGAKCFVERLIRPLKQFGCCCALIALRLTSSVISPSATERRCIIYYFFKIIFVSSYACASVWMLRSVEPTQGVGHFRHFLS